jgi:short-subunit dehydrogenase
MAENKTIVVTGGTKGIGKAIIEIFAKNGFTIFTCSRNEDDLDRLSEEISNTFNVDVFVRQADLSIKEEVAAFADFVKERTDSVDVLVNNSGRFIPGQVHNEEEGVLEDLVNTNLYSAYHLTRKFVNDMIERKSGHIFNICSIASIVAYANGGSYGITKFAMYGMSKVLREELKEHQIRVTSVLPGATYTASWEGADIPEDRFMTSEDVATMVWSTYSLSPRTVVEDIVIRPQLGDL